MSECIKNCRLCNKFIISTAVTFNPQANVLVIGLPAGSYLNCTKYCIVIAQRIPENVTISTRVVFTIGTSAVQYPFLNGDCTPIYASQIRTRRLYPTRVFTDVQSGVFKYIGNCPLPCCAITPSQSIPPTVQANNIANVEATEVVATKK